MQFWLGVLLRVSKSEILHLINKIWERDNDIRFFQLIYILQTKFSEANGNIGKVESTVDDEFSQVGYDFFSIEDDAFIQFLKEIVDQDI